jgi:hypothetical protein
MGCIDRDGKINIGLILRRAGIVENMSHMPYEGSAKSQVMNEQLDSLISKAG